MTRVRSALPQRGVPCSLALAPRSTLDGTPVGLYLLLAGAERFVIEVFRAKDDRLMGPFTVAQALSALVVVVGIAWLRRGPASMPAAA